MLGDMTGRRARRRAWRGVSDGTCAGAAAADLVRDSSYVQWYYLLHSIDKQRGGLRQRSGVRESRTVCELRAPALSMPICRSL